MSKVLISFDYMSKYGSTLYINELQHSLSLLSTNNHFKPYHTIIDTTSNNITLSNQIYNFTRQSKAYIPNQYYVVESNQPRIVEKDGKTGILIEEGTTNLFGSFSNTFDANQTLFCPSGLAYGKTWADCWDSNENAYHGGEGITTYIIYTRPIDLGFTTTQDTEITITWEHKGYLWFFIASYSSDGINFTNWNKDTPYTVTKYHNCELALWEGTHGLHLKIDGIRLSSNSNPPNYWKRIGVTFKVPANTRYVRFTWDFYEARYYNTQGGWMRNFQLEAKPYATSFINGTRANEELKIPAYNVVNPSEGTIEMWAFVPDYTPYQTAVHWKKFWTIIEGNVTDTKKEKICLHFQKQPHNLRVAWNNGTDIFNYPISHSIEPSLLVGYRYITVRWKANQELSLFIDGIKVATATSNIPQFSITPNDYIYLGGSPLFWTWVNYDYGNLTFDSIRISNKARSDEEIMQTYQQGYFEVDSWTTYMLNFNDKLIINNINIINLSTTYIPEYIKSYLQISNNPSYNTFEDICDDTLQLTSIDGVTRTGKEWTLYFLSNKYFKLNNTPTSSQLLIPASGIVIFRHDVYFKENSTYDIYYWIKRNGYPVTSIIDFIHDNNQNKVDVTKTLITTTDDGWELYKATFTPTTDIDGAYVIVRNNQQGWYYNDIFVTGFTIIERDTSTQLPLYSTPSLVYDDDSYVEYTIDIQPDDVLILNFTKYNTNNGIKGLLTVTDNTNNLEIYIDNNTFKVNTNVVETVTLNSTDVYTLKIDFQTNQIQLINNTNETTILTYTHNVNFNYSTPLKVRIGDGITIKSTTVTQVFTDLIVLS